MLVGKAKASGVKVTNNGVFLAHVNIWYGNLVYALLVFTHTFLVNNFTQYYPPNPSSTRESQGEGGFQVPI